MVGEYEAAPVSFHTGKGKEGGEQEGRGEGEGLGEGEQEELGKGELDGMEEERGEGMLGGQEEFGAREKQAGEGALSWRRGGGGLPSVDIGKIKSILDQTQGDTEE